MKHSAPKSKTNNLEKKESDYVRTRKQLLNELEEIEAEEEIKDFYKNEDRELP